MACVSPYMLSIFDMPDSPYKKRAIRWFKLGLNPNNLRDGKYIECPCGRCLNCIVDKRNFLEDCCKHEFQRFDCGAFCTFTYDDYSILHCMKQTYNGSYLPSINSSDCVKLRYRINKLVASIPQSAYVHHDYKVLWCMEYGEDKNRPHIHACFFGLDYRFLKTVRKQIWKFGKVDCGAIRKGGIRYILSYLDKCAPSLYTKEQFEILGIERPKVTHSKGISIKFVLDNAEYLRKHNFCYSVKGGKERPLPSYYRKMLYDTYKINKDEIMCLMYRYGKQPDSYFINKSGQKVETFSLKAMNKFRHDNSIKRYKGLLEQVRSRGSPAYDVLHPDSYLKQYKNFLVDTGNLISENPFLIKKGLLYYKNSPIMEVRT